MSGRTLAEIKQRRPFESPAVELSVNLLRTTDALQRRLEAALRPSRLSLTQYNVLRILRGAGAEGLPTLDVSDRMIERTPAITRLVDKLEAKKLIRRKRCQDDRRRVLCFIEPKGLELLAELDAPIAKAGETAMAGLKAKQTLKLIRLLELLRTSE